MRRTIHAIVAAVLLAAPAPAMALKRVALVIGNASYPAVGALINPPNDAQALQKLFTDAHFDLVETKLDLSREAFLVALREFSDKSADADVAVIYYAGHGMEMGGTNYLIPTDARLATDSAIPDETVSLDRVMLAVDTAKRLRLIILDACRNNPFARGMRRSKSTRAAAVGGGLARVEVDTSDTYVAFAAKAGYTADDGDVHSPFAKALIQHLTTPGLDVRIALGRVRDAVLAETAGEQEPYVYGSLGGDIIPLVPGAETAALPAPPPVRPAGPVPKPQTIDIGTTVSRHGDWTVNCQRSSTAPKDQCALVQSVIASDRANIGLTAIFLHSSEGKLLMRVVVPNGILLSSGLGLKIDQEDIGRAGLVRCIDAGCVAEINVEAPLLAKLERGKQATFIVFMTPTEGIGIPISLPGIAAGLERLRL